MVSFLQRDSTKKIKTRIKNAEEEKNWAQKEYATNTWNPNPMECS